VWGAQAKDSDSASDGQKSMFPPMFAVLGFRGQSTAVRFTSLSGGGRSQPRCLGWYNKVGHPFFFPLDMGFVGVSVWGSGSDRLRRVPSGACLYGRRASMREGISTIYQPAQVTPPKRNPLNNLRRLQLRRPRRSEWGPYDETASIEDGTDSTQNV
jgi:hypothetical protein